MIKIIRIVAEFSTPSAHLSINIWRTRKVQPPGSRTTLERNLTKVRVRPSRESERAGRNPLQRRPIIRYTPASILPTDDRPMRIEITEELPDEAMLLWYKELRSWAHDQNP